MSQAAQGGDKRSKRELSARRIIGFACAQAFLFFLFYLEGFDLAVDGFGFASFGLAATLLFMVVGFAVMRSLSPAGRTRAFSRPLLYVYAIVAAFGSFLPFLPVGNSEFLAVAEGALAGLPLAYLLAAWGRAFGREPTINSVPEIFLGTLVAAVVFCVFSLAISTQTAQVMFRILPIASVVNLEVPRGDVPRAPATVEVESGKARTLSAKMLAGTALFGVAAGLADTLYFEPWYYEIPFYQLGMVFLVAFLSGALSLLLSNGFGRGDALSKSYRLAVFVMMVGVLVMPLLAQMGMRSPSGALMLAGYLGLQAVLISLFAVVARITASDCSLSFSAGFSALFAGELFGIVVTNIVRMALGAGSGVGMVLIADALAGVAVLVGYIFLFTERDFDELSKIVTANDTFEDVCGHIASLYGLSPRESEILAFALRGRTNERIAQELVIAKSTVDTHLRRIYGKCGVHSRQELLDLAEDAARDVG